MKKGLIVLVSLLLVLVLAGCARSQYFGPGYGYMYDWDHFTCQKIDSVQTGKTQYWPPTEDRNFNQSLYILEDGTPVTVVGTRQFAPGWYIRDTSEDKNPAMMGPSSTQEECLAKAKDMYDHFGFFEYIPESYY
jgi:hypothetical protein